MLNDLNLWNKIGRIVYNLSKTLDVDLPRAFDLFYSSRTCKLLHDENSGLYLYSDAYILEDLMIELRAKHG